jgi:hypothetical protein
MARDADVIAEIDEVFGGQEKPAHFTDYWRCEECAEHDELLRRRDRETLKIQDVGNVGWNPMAFCNGLGIAYYFPALARFALSPPTYEYGWYGDLLLFHLNHDGSDSFLEFCDARQRKAVLSLLRHLEETRSAREGHISTQEEFAQARALWSTG